MEDKIKKINQDIAKLVSDFVNDTGATIDSISINTNYYGGRTIEPVVTVNCKFVYMQGYGIAGGFGGTGR